MITVAYSMGTMLGESRQRSNPSNFLGLPLEIRRVIYRHLLIPSRIVTMRRDAYDIEPAILLTNKEIYEQASWVLYRDNDWVLLSVNAPLQTFLEGWQLEDTLQRYPIIPLAETSFTKTPRLELEIREMSAKMPGTARRDLKRFMVSLDGLPRVCQILTAARNTSDLEIVAKFAEVKTSTLDKILDCLEEACGFGNVIVEGLDAAATETATTKLIMPEASTSTEISKRTKRHEVRIDEHIANGRFIHAMKACQDGMAYVEFVYKSVHYRRLGPPFFMMPIFRKFIEYALKHARCCLKCGDHQSARHILSLFLASVPHHSLYRAVSLRCEGHFYYGLSLVAGGAENAAAFSFAQTLELVHDHERAHEALDAMEARLALRGSDAESIRLRTNLENIRTWRHRKVQDGQPPTKVTFIVSNEEEASMTSRPRTTYDGTVSCPLPQLSF